MIIITLYHLLPTSRELGPCVLCLVAQSCPTLCNPMNCSPPGFSVHRNSPGKNTWVGWHALLQGNLPSPGIKPRSPALQADSLPAEPQIQYTDSNILSEPPGKPSNIHSSSLSPTRRISTDALWSQSPPLKSVEIKYVVEMLLLICKGAFAVYKPPYIPGPKERQLNEQASQSPWQQPGSLISLQTRRA